jgi:hypothetical protein
MMLHLALPFTVACCTRRFSFVEGIHPREAKLLVLPEPKKE